MDKRHAPYRCQRTATNLARRVVTCPVLSKLVWVQSNIYTGMHRAREKRGVVPRLCDTQTPLAQ